MALIVEDGTGMATADSYVDVAFADTYVNVYMGDSAHWTTLPPTISTVSKERALQNATMYLDNTYKMRWQGLSISLTQALSFPRSGVIDVEGRTLPSTTIPLNLKRATVEAAVRFLDPDISLDGDILRTDTGVKRLKQKFDVMEQEVEFIGVAQERDTFTRIDQLLSEFLVSAAKRITAERG